jgi:hypothetical protein
MVMVLGMAIASMIPAEAHGGGSTSFEMGTGSDLATVAGPAHPNLSGPYQQEHYDNWGH